MDSVEKAISLWIGRITQSQEKLGGHSVCPFAKKLPTVIKTSKIDKSLFTTLSNNLTIFCETTINSSFNDLQDLCNELNNEYPNHTFLPDHPYRKTFLNGIETGNGCYPLILVQPKIELQRARNKLSKTDYYSYWDKEYLEEIFSYDNMDRMGQTN